jgi:aspartyl-tRNA(Asn)/glutamyl-tRNA(Gln) amidotransferase subunit A
MAGGGVDPDNRLVAASLEVEWNGKLPIPPFAIADLAGPDARTKELQMLRNTRPFNLFALSTISVPCGFTRAGFPIGMQIIGPPSGEAVVLRLALAYEQATDWHQRKPNVG